MAKDVPGVLKALGYGSPDCLVLGARSWARPHPSTGRGRPRSDRCVAIRTTGVAFAATRPRRGRRRRPDTRGFRSWREGGNVSERAHAEAGRERPGLARRGTIQTIVGQRTTDDGNRYKSPTLREGGGSAGGVLLVCATGQRLPGRQGPVPPQASVASSAPAPAGCPECPRCVRTPHRRSGRPRRGPACFPRPGAAWRRR